MWPFDLIIFTNNPELILSIFTVLQYEFHLQARWFLPKKYFAQNAFK